MAKPEPFVVVGERWEAEVSPNRQIFNIRDLTEPGILTLVRLQDLPQLREAIWELERLIQEAEQSQTVPVGAFVVGFSPESGASRIHHHQAGGTVRNLTPEGMGELLELLAELEEMARR